jgi:hypothetical protein
MDPVPSFDRADYLSTPAAAEAVRVANHATYVRAILFGIGAAIAGCILYAVVEIATGWTIGYLALAVGYMVGKAMKAGSRGAGGRRYQIAAAILTYASVSSAAIPVGIQQYSKQHEARQAAVNSAQQAHPFPGDGTDATQPASQPKATHSAVYSIAMLLALGLASPFMELGEGVGGIIGLFILFIGIRAAWQLTAGSELQIADSLY